MRGPLLPALLLRVGFATDGVAKNKRLADLAGDDVFEQKDLSYGHERDAKLDVYYPKVVAGSKERLPTIVWVHGGAWVGGDKSHISNYLKLLAGQGYTVVGVNYSRAPGAKFPESLRQVMEALAWIQARTAALHVDSSRLVLAGDSAGAHIASQIVAMTVNLEYARALGIYSPVEPGHIRGAVLFCGAYDVELLDFEGRLAWFLHTVLSAYTGSKNLRGNPCTTLLSVRNWVTSDFPAPFISAGNADPLGPQSTALAETLVALGVEPDTLFFAADHEPRLNHEYQFDARLKEFDLALERSLTYLRKVLAQPTPTE